MRDPLENAKKLLNELDQSIEELKKIWSPPREDLSFFFHPKPRTWEEKKASCWISGSGEITESDQLEKRVQVDLPLSDLAKDKASHSVKCWKEWLSIKQAYYEYFDAFEFEEPRDGETNLEFLVRMAYLVEEEGPGARLEWRAFKSFLGYLRKLSPEEVAFIEHVFPRKMDIFHGRIIRKIAPEEPALPIKNVSELLRELAFMARHGHKNVQLGALESLGLCWICLTAARLRLPIDFETLHATDFSALFFDKEIPNLQVPTLFGLIEIGISNLVFRFLDTLAHIPSKKPRATILQRSSRSLKRPFETALQNIQMPEKFGNITYVSLLKSPHYAGEHRFQPKKALS